METVTTYQQKMYISPPHRWAPRMTKVTEYFLPKDKIILSTDGHGFLSTEDALHPRLSVQDLDRDDRSSCNAQEVREVVIKEDVYAHILEWHRSKKRVEELKKKLEDVFFYEEGDY